MLGSLAVDSISVVILSPWTVETEVGTRVMASLTDPPLVSRAENGKLSVENKIQPAVCPEMRDCGMRQLLVMSPQAFQGYELPPAVAGRALPPSFSFSSLCTHNTTQLPPYKTDSEIAAVLINCPSVKPFICRSGDLNFGGNLKL